METVVYNRTKIIVNYIHYTYMKSFFYKFAHVCIAMQSSFIHSYRKRFKGDLVLSEHQGHVTMSKS